MLYRYKYIKNKKCKFNFKMYFTNTRKTNENKKRSF